MGKDCGNKLITEQERTKTKVLKQVSTLNKKLVSNFFDLVFTKNLFDIDSLNGVKIGRASLKDITSWIEEYTSVRAPKDEKGKGEFTSAEQAIKAVEDASGAKSAEVWRELRIVADRHLDLIAGFGLKHEQIEEFYKDNQVYTWMHNFIGINKRRNMVAFFREIPVIHHIIGMNKNKARKLDGATERVTNTYDEMIVQFEHNTGNFNDHLQTLNERHSVDKVVTPDELGSLVRYVDDGTDKSSKIAIDEFILERFSNMTKEEQDINRDLVTKAINGLTEDFERFNYGDTKEIVVARINERAREIDKAIAKRDKPAESEGLKEKVSLDKKTGESDISIEAKDLATKEYFETPRTINDPEAKETMQSYFSFIATSGKRLVSMIKNDERIAAIKADGYPNFKEYVKELYFRTKGNEKAFTKADHFNKLELDMILKFSNTFLNDRSKVGETNFNSFLFRPVLSTTYVPGFSKLNGNGEVNGVEDVIEKSGAQILKSFGHQADFFRKRDDGKKVNLADESYILAWQTGAHQMFTVMQRVGEYAMAKTSRASLANTNKALEVANPRAYELIMDDNEEYINYYDNLQYNDVKIGKTLASFKRLSAAGISIVGTSFLTFSGGINWIMGKITTAQEVGLLNTFQSSRFKKALADSSNSEHDVASTISEFMGFNAIATKADMFVPDMADRSIGGDGYVISVVDKLTKTLANTASDLSNYPGGPMFRMFFENKVIQDTVIGSMGTWMKDNLGFGDSEVNLAKIGHDMMFKMIAPQIAIFKKNNPSEVDVKKETLRLAEAYKGLTIERVKSAIGEFSKTSKPFWMYKELRDATTIRGLMMGGALVSYGMFRHVLNINHNKLNQLYGKSGTFSDLTTGDFGQLPKSFMRDMNKFVTLKEGRLTQGDSTMLFGMAFLSMVDMITEDNKDGHYRLNAVTNNNIFETPAALHGVIKVVSAAWSGKPMTPDEAKDTKNVLYYLSGVPFSKALMGVVDERQTHHWKNYGLDHIATDFMKNFDLLKDTAKNKPFDIENLIKHSAGLVNNIPMFNSFFSKSNDLVSFNARLVDMTKKAYNSVEDDFLNGVEHKPWDKMRAIDFQRLLGNLTGVKIYNNYDYSDYKKGKNKYRKRKWVQGSNARSIYWGKYGYTKYRRGKDSGDNPYADGLRRAFLRGYGSSYNPMNTYKYLERRGNE